jgi:EAL and modified HD-GYP domain-containing signal transduction protein
MKSFFQRLLPGLLGGKAAQTDQQSAMTHASTAVPHATKLAPAQMPAGVALPSIGARRPLISGKGEIVGFEFRIGEDMLRRMSRRADDSAKAAHARAVLMSAQLLANSGRLGLARLPADCLIHATGLDNLTGLWIGVDQDISSGTPTPAQLQVLALTLQDLRALGVRLAWDVRLALPLTPDFVLMAQASQSMPDVLQTLQALPAAWQGLPTLVTDIATFEDLELALHSQVSYVCGSLAATPMASNTKERLPLAPEVGRIGNLLNQLVTGAENDVIVANIKSDVGLSYRLLQRINSASFARINAGASIDQAVLLLGRSELYRWLSMLLFQFAGRRKTSSALQEVALWRSRLLELLAQHNHEESPAQLFTLGLASMMGPILSISLREVLSILHLHPNAQQALVERQGPWHAYLQVALLVESQNLDDDNPLVTQFGGVQSITALSDAAWDWAWSAMHSPQDGNP